MPRPTLLAAALGLTVLLTACATRPARLDAAEQAQLAALLPTDALLLGEQHDAAEHHRLERATVQWLAARGVLAALVLEMAEQGHGSAGLPRHASATQVRDALAWDGQGWPWADYGPLVMAAVRAGVPVLGANLPRAQLRQAMQDRTLDTRLPPAAWAEQQERIREGHCGLLPESQIIPMTRVQIARDIAMADTVARAVQPGRTVLLVAGNGHVQRGLGVPMHLPPGVTVKVISAQSRQQPQADRANTAAAEPGRPDAGADRVWATPALPQRDPCAELRRQLHTPLPPAPP